MSRRRFDRRRQPELIGTILGLVMALSAGVFGVASEDAGTATPSASRADTVLTQLTIAPASHESSYVRKKFGATWIDADKNCRNTRAEVLIAESQDPVTFKDQRECTVKAGLWFDPWSKRSETTAGSLDVDHTVPLANAWRSGAWRWSDAERLDYANDLQDEGHLIAILLGVNRQKGDSGPEEWKPPVESTWCDYALTWDHIKARWNLTATSEEWDALNDMAATC